MRVYIKNYSVRSMMYLYKIAAHGVSWAAQVLIANWFCEFVTAALPGAMFLCTYCTYYSGVCIKYSEYFMLSMWCSYRWFEFRAPAFYPILFWGFSRGRVVRSNGVCACACFCVSVTRHDRLEYTPSCIWLGVARRSFADTATSNRFHACSRQQAVLTAF